MSWWSDWFIGLLIASGILIIFKGGFVFTLILWLIFLGNGAKTVERLPSKENKEELAKYVVIGIIVLAISGGIKIAALLD